MKDVYEQILIMLDSGATGPEILEHTTHSREAADILDMLEALKTIPENDLRPNPSILRNAIVASQTISVTDKNTNRLVVESQDSSPSFLNSFIYTLTESFMNKRIVFIGTGAALFVAIIAVGAYMAFSVPSGFSRSGIDQDLAYQIEHIDIAQDLQEVDSFMAEDIDLETDLLLLAALDAPVDPVDIDTLDAELESDLNTLLSDFEDLESFGEIIDPELDEIVS